MSATSTWTRRGTPAGVLIHPQPDGVWRIDWQVPPGTDADAERANGGLDRRIREVIGSETPLSSSG